MKAAAKKIVLRSARIVYVFPSIMDRETARAAKAAQEEIQIQIQLTKRNDPELTRLMRVMKNNPNYGARLSYNTCPGLCEKVFEYYDQMLTMHELKQQNPDETISSFLFFIPA